MGDLCRTIWFFEIKNHTELVGTLEQLVGRPCPEGSRTILAQVHGYARPFCFGATCFSIQKPYVFIDMFRLHGYAGPLLIVLLIFHHFSIK